MIQATAINFKSAVAAPKRKVDKKLLVGVLMFTLALAAFFYWRHFNLVRQARVPSTAARTVPAGTAAAAVKPDLAASSPKAGDKPALTKSDQPVTPKASIIGFADSLIAAISPSAKGETVQPEMQFSSQPVTEMAKPAKRITMQAVAVPPALHETKATTPEQLRLRAAQDGFADILNLAYKYPDTYGFLTTENLDAAKLGDAIPVYRVEQPGRESYAGQPVKSLFKPADEWVYPIILGNRIRFLIQVRYVGHDYVLGHGSRALAMAYDKILARWPASEGFHPQLVTMPNLPFYYFSIPELPNQNLTDTTRMFDFNPSLSPASVMLASWR